MVVIRRSSRLSSKVAKPVTKEKVSESTRGTKLTATVDKQFNCTSTSQINFVDKNDIRKPKIRAPKFPANINGQRYWLIKSEPVKRIVDGNDISFSLRSLADVDSEPWNGVRNYEARNNLLSMKVDDLCLFYHSNCKIPGIVGIAKVVASASPDDGQFDPKDPYFDPKSKKEAPKWWCPRVKFYRRFRSKLSLPELREISSGPGSKLNEFMLVKRGRLSVIPVSESEYDELMEIEKTLSINDEIDCKIPRDLITPQDK